MNKKGFTLVELLIVIGILAVLAAAVVVVLNPAELLAQARDSQRMQDLNGLNSTLSLYAASMSPPVFGETAHHSQGVVTADLCGLTQQPTVAGIAVADNRKVQGAGWVSVNLTAMTGGSPLAALPVDPVNNTTYYYCYDATNTGATWELLAQALESTKYGGGASTGMDYTDGGEDDTCYEVGTDEGLNLM